MDSPKVRNIQFGPKRHQNNLPNVEVANSESADFNPYSCDNEDGIGFWGAAILIIKGSIGCAFLLMPYLMKNLGYVTGTIIVISSGIVYYHTLHSILSVKYQLSKDLKTRTQFSYVELAEKTIQRSPFPINKLHSSVKYFMYLFYSIPTNDAAYLILTATEIQRLARRFRMDLKIKYIVTAEIIPLTCFCMVPKILKILVPFSVVTYFLTILMAVSTVISSMIQRKESIRLKPFGNVYSIPEYIARCINAFCCTGIILPINNNMQKPHKMASSFGSINVAAFAVILFYCSFGIILYANYGDEVEDNVLSNLPTNNYLTDIIELLYTCSLFVTYILAFFGCFDNVWSGSFKEAFKGKKYEIVVEYGIRLGINLLAYLLAIGVPNLSIVLALAGTASFVVEVALPSILEALSAISSRQKNSWIILKNLMIISLSLILFSLSMTSCINQIFAMYSERKYLE